MPIEKIIMVLLGPALTLLGLGLASWLHGRETSAETEEHPETQDDFTPAMRRWEAMLGHWGVWQ